jgi:hypothetical protein
MSINNKEDIINYLGHKYNLKKYFEISSVINGFIYDKIDNSFFTKELFLYNPPNINLTNIRNDTDILPIDYDIGIEKYKNNKYDIIFIDSFHTFEQSIQDMEFAYSLLNDNGFIIIHDCAPSSINLIGDYKSTGAWCGQTYSAFIHYKMKTPYIKSCVVNIDFGCGIISINKLNKDVFKLDNLLTLKEVSQWHYFTNNKKKLLNLISINEFKKLY